MCLRAADGEHLGSLSESGTQESIINPFAAGPYGSPYTQQLQAPASADPAGDINPKQGLEHALLDSLFQRPSAELVRVLFCGYRDLSSQGWQSHACMYALHSRLAKCRAMLLNMHWCTSMCLHRCVHCSTALILPSLPHLEGSLGQMVYTKWILPT